MGKSTGFLEYQRLDNPAEAPLSRIKHWKEFHPLLPQEQRRRQGARCMECGVPFCQSGLALLGGAVSGCPLHNLIPEWNDLIYTGNFGHALKRLYKTNNFPEFTGRVCPALCEAACTCGLNGDPVTVKENELGVVEDCFARGLIAPRIPKVRTGKKAAVVGSGPAGLAAAAQLNMRGHSVTVFEREDRAGGLLMYGIPNMKLEKEIVERRVKLMAAEGVEFRTGTDVGRDVEAKALLEAYDVVLLCCGAKKPRDLAAGNREMKGVHFAVDFLGAATKSLLDSGFKDGRQISAKGKQVVIVGGGDTGNDCVGTSIRQGCKSVTQIEMMPRLPDRRAEDNPWPQWPFLCKTDYGQEEAIAVFGKDPRIYQTTVKKLTANAEGRIKSLVTIALKPEQKDGRTIMTEIPETEKTLPCDLLLIAAGFLGPEDYVPEAFGLARDGRGNVQTQPDKYRTGRDKVFAAGDMRRGQSLVVWAIAEGRLAAREADAYLLGYTNL
jgi:glutamate synthase (NADPH/NADH) small chain